MKKRTNFSLIAAILLWYTAAMSLMNMSRAFGAVSRMNFAAMWSSLILPLLTVAANALLGIVLFRQNRGGALIGAFVFRLAILVMSNCLLVNGTLILPNLAFLFRNNYGFSVLLSMISWVFLLLLAVRAVRSKGQKKTGSLLWVLALACQIIGLLMGLSYTTGMLSVGVSITSYMMNMVLGILEAAFIGLGLSNPVVEKSAEQGGTTEGQQPQAADASVYRELLESGVISQEEYDIWAAQNKIDQK